MELTISVSGHPPVNLRKFKEDLAKMCKTYYQSIPLKAIDASANLNGIKMIDEDGSDWEGFLTGREGRASIELADLSGSSLGKYLHLQWHKMQSGKYEINAYTD